MTKTKQLTLSTKQIKFLKGLAHHLDPVVQIGKEGITDSVLDTVDRELKNHELIKVKMGQNCPIDKKDAPKEITDAVSCAFVQLIGKTMIFYRPNINKAKDKRIILPKD